MPVAARLVTTVTAPLSSPPPTGRPDRPGQPHRPAQPAHSDRPGPLPFGLPQLRVFSGGRRLLVQQGDAEVGAVALGGAESPGVPVGAVRFPAPWPRRFGEVAVLPGLEVAVFAGTHALRAVAADGSTVWEVRHGCWVCGSLHPSFEAYADDPRHRFPDGGSVTPGSDGTLLWAHVPGPLEGDDPGAANGHEWWLVLDAASGRVLGRAVTETVASGSVHLAGPDPSRMGLSIGVGEEGSPALRGRWNGRRLVVERRAEERFLLAVSPSGRWLLEVDTGQWSLLLLDAESGETLAELDAEGAVPPPHPHNSTSTSTSTSTSNDRVYWDFDAAFLDEDTLVAGTSESDQQSGRARHWLVDVLTDPADSRPSGLALRGEVAYPAGPVVAGAVVAAGSGTWATVAADGGAVHLWESA
ncbi:hypothetical protein [Kitasatospora sp. NPDC057198]|uniref:hypothetical protein n=1 Tax=Kitasatospora sp. NPDC057198 TaxID=3346046 RepID=UPI0036398083